MSAALVMFVGITLLSNVLTLGFCSPGEEALVSLMSELQVTDRVE